MSVIVSLMGGLGFFLYGMKLMSEGLQKVAGSKMRSILEVFTKNRVIGLLVGIFFTALIQSSNATTVMVVSFVNSGLMKLAQAPGIILGANIGTTVTGQLIAFDLADIAPLFVIIGVLMVMFVKNNLTISRLGEVILGFGILFMGISGISGALNEAKEILAFELTKMVHGEEEAEKAKEASHALFSGAGASANMPTIEVNADDFANGTMDIMAVLVKAGLCESRSEARRGVQQGGVSVDGEKVTDISTTYTLDDFAGEGKVVKRGKKKFAKVVAVN